MDYNDFIVIKTKQPFHENDSVKQGKVMEEQVMKMYNCPYRNTKFLSMCPYCGNMHTKPKTYTDMIYSISKEEKPISLGLTLKRRDIPQIMKSLKEV